MCISETAATTTVTVCLLYSLNLQFLNRYCTLRTLFYLKKKTHQNKHQTLILYLVPWEPVPIATV